MNPDPHGLKQSYSAGSMEGAGLQKKGKAAWGISSLELSMARSEPRPQPFKTTLKSIYTLLWFAESQGVAGNMSIFISTPDAFSVLPLHTEEGDLSKISADIFG